MQFNEIYKIGEFASAIANKKLEIQDNIEALQELELDYQGYIIYIENEVQKSPAKNEKQRDILRDKLKGEHVVDCELNINRTKNAIARLKIELDYLQIHFEETKLLYTAL